MQEACENGDLGLVKKLLKNPKLIIQELDIYAAINNGHLDILKYLIQPGEIIHEWAIDVAEKKGYWDIVDYLLMIGAKYESTPAIEERIRKLKNKIFMTGKKFPKELNEEIASFFMSRKHLFGSPRRSRKRSRRTKKSNSIEAYFSKIDTKFVNQYPKTRNRKECLPDNYYRHLSELTTEEKTLVKNSQFLWCKGAIGKNYINDMLVSDKYIITAKYQPENKSMCGFVIFSILEDAIYIDLLCAISSDNFKGVSTSLMHKIKEIAIGLGLKKVILSSVPGARGFYEKLGYVYSHNPCVGKEFKRPIKKLYNMGICL